ncbi:MAG: nitroreductase family protein [Anaerolineae bacterium]|nr:nitroreductase family protein [Anaerolineae bacterium]
MLTNETLAVIRQRRSIRRYQPEQISDAERDAILAAGQCAPHAGAPVWHFTAVQNRVLLQRLNQAAKAAVRQMGIPGLLPLAENEAYDCLYGAPTLVIVSAAEASPLPPEADCAAAVQNMLLAAQSLGLGSCWIFFVTMAFLSPQGGELREALRLPAGYKPLFSAVFGYPSEAAPERPPYDPGVVTVID